MHEAIHPISRTGRIVTVIVPCRNEAAHLHGFLAALRSQEVPENVEIEVVVADGRSDDGTREILDREAERDPALRVVDNPERTTAQGLNRALAEVRGEVIIRMDVHTRYAPDYIRQCVAALDGSGAESVGGPWVAAGEDPTARAVAAAMQSRFGMGGGRAHRRDYEGPVDSVYLGCWRRETLERLDGFDTGAVRSQDAELNWRIRRQGGVVWQTPAIRSWYAPRDSLGDVFRQFASWGYWKLRLILKEPHGASPRQFVPAALLLTVLLLAVLAPFVPAAALLLAGLGSAYVLAAILAAVLARREAGGWRYVPGIIAAFFTFHLAYGGGFLRAVLHLVLGRYPGAPERAAPQYGARSDYVLTFGTEMAVLVAALVVFRLAADAWGTAGFGEYVLARRAISLLQPPLLLGLGIALARYIAEESATGQGREGALFTAAVLLAGGAASAGIALLNLAPSATAALLLGSPEAEGLVAPLSWGVAGLVLHGLAYGEFRGRLAMGGANTLQAVDLGVIPVAALLVPGLGPEGVIALTGRLWCAVAGTVVLWRLWSLRGGRGTLGTAVARMLRFGGPRVPGELGFALLLALPVILTAHVAGAEAAGFVGLGVALVRLAGALFAPLGRVLLPASALAMASGDRTAVLGGARTLGMASLLVTGIGVLVFLPLAPGILTSYLGDGFAAAVPVVRMLAVGAVPFALFIVLRNVLDAVEVRALNTRNTAIALVVLAAAALPLQTPLGIALAATAAFLVLGVLSARDAYRLLRPATRP